jgi:hypothetical protein
MKLSKFIKRHFCEKITKEDQSFKKFMEGKLHEKEENLFKKSVNFSIDLKRLVGSVLKNEPQSDLDSQIRQKFKTIGVDECSDSKITNILQGILNENINTHLNTKSKNRDANKDKLFSHILTMIQGASFTVKEKEKQVDFNLSKYWY